MTLDLTGAPSHRLLTRKLPLLHSLLGKEIEQTISASFITQATDFYGRNDPDMVLTPYQLLLIWITYTKISLK